MMRAGTETGSLINHVMSASVAPTPVVGMGITILHWTDRSAGTIVKVSPSGKTFWFTTDTTKRIDKNGMSEMQEYAYTSNLDATPSVARLTKRGWRSAGLGIALGYRRAYHDFSF